MNDNIFSAYGSLNIAIYMCLEKLKKYGYAYSFGPQLVNYISHNSNADNLNNDSIELIITELIALQESLFNFRKEKKDNHKETIEINRDIYYLYRHTSSLIKRFEDCIEYDI